MSGREMRILLILHIEAVWALVLFAWTVEFFR